jgi:CBS domain-containing protein
MVSTDRGILPLGRVDMDTVSSLVAEKGFKVISVVPDTTAFDIARTMSENHIGAVLVVEGSTPVGIVSERDLMTRVILEGLDPKVAKAGAIMTRDLVVVSAQTPIQEAMAVMTQQRCRHLPVLGDGHLVGLVSIGDCTRWASRRQEFTIHHMRDYIADKYPR